VSIGEEILAPRSESPGFFSHAKTKRSEKRGGRKLHRIRKLSPKREEKKKEANMFSIEGRKNSGTRLIDRPRKENS